MPHPPHVSIVHLIMIIIVSIGTCRIDADFVIKVADFGLSERLYSRNYFRQRKDEGDLKLPIKWMAIESLRDGVFSEKSDVVSSQHVCAVSSRKL